MQKKQKDRTTEYVKTVFTSLLRHYDNLLRSNGNILAIRPNVNFMQNMIYIHNSLEKEK